MSDILCRVCNEPWDIYGVSHGDMMKWEARLFNHGAGCPCCEGEQPEDLSDDEALENFGRSLVYGSHDDPDSMMEALYRNKPMAWTKPDPKSIVTCAGCGVSVGLDPDNEETPMWFGGEKVHYWSGFAGCYGAHHNHEEPDGYTNEEEWVKVNDEPYCPGCATVCDECYKAPIFKRSDLDPGDSYAVGASFPHPNDMTKAVCVDCFELFPSEEEE
jgi:hypothetical protein